VIALLKRSLELPAVRGVPHDAPEMLAIHRAVIRGKPFLRRLYLDHYAEFRRQLAGAPAGPVLELGSGGGFLAEALPGVITSDVTPGEGIDRVMAADALAVPDGSLAGIVMLNVFHHLPDPRAFLREAVRALRPGGRVVMIEPAHTLLWSRLYRWFSPEPYDAASPGWGFSGGGRLSGANIPGAWIVFVRDRERYRAEFPGLAIRRVRLHTALSYVWSGGIWYRAILPGWAYPGWHAVEFLLTPLHRWLACQMTVVLVKPGGPADRMDPT
jgi:SAM-dependent methyltransferase